VLGRDDLSIVPLHETALARGARPHWLGQIGVGDVDALASVFVGRGATRLGPTARGGDGGPFPGVEFAVVRDPGGAVVALATPATMAPVPEVAWHVLHTADAARAGEAYQQLFGWHVGARVDGGAPGVFHELAWESGGAIVGAIGDLAGRPDVHPHWLYCFRVASLEPAIAAARAAGGLVLEPFALPDGTRVAVCDDAQGAAFGLAANH
jgi:predicted enzyme related to lactoylglutathione lyase